MTGRGRADSKTSEVPVCNGPVRILGARGGWREGAGGRVEGGSNPENGDTTDEEGDPHISGTYRLLPEVHPGLCHHRRSIVEPHLQG